MLERYGLVYNTARRAVGSLIPKENRAEVRRKLYDIEDLFRFGLSNLEYYGTRDIFGHVYFESNKACNWNKCMDYCPQPYFPRRDGEMSQDVFKTMISQLSSFGRRGFRGIIGPVFFNEPTMLGDRLVDMMDAIRKNLPLCWIQLNTNGIILTPEFARNLLDVGVSQIIITKHKGVPTKNIERVQNRLYQEINKGKIVIRTLDNIKLWNRGGMVNIPSDRVLHTERCRMASNQLTIDYQGNVIFCCNNYTTSYKEGNIMEKEIKEIWKNPGFVARRDQARRGEYTLDLCKKCMGVDRAS